MSVLQFDKIPYENVKEGLQRKIKKIFSYVAGFTEWMLDYEGLGAPLVKALYVILLLIVLMYPWWSYPLWINFGLWLGKAWSIIALTLWLIQWPTLFLLAAYVKYRMEGSDRRYKMELSRKIGIGIVMMIPTFVFSGLLWDLSHSWIAVIILIAAMIYLYKEIITGKIKSLFTKKS